MEKHSKAALDSISCPFAVNFADFNFGSIRSVISVDDYACSIIVETEDNQRFLIEIPKNIFSAIWSAGEKNVIEQDPGFNDMY
jgi:hypothetical protein